MRFGKRAVIAVGLDEGMAELLDEVRGMDFLKHSEVHLVTVFKTIDYAYGFGEQSLVFPIPDDRKVIEQSALATLVKLWEKISPRGFEGKMLARCLFDQDAKEKLCEYVKEVKADTVIVAKRRKRGLFESSFAQYLTTHTDADMVIIKK